MKIDEDEENIEKKKLLMPNQTGDIYTIRTA